ncbi:MAG: 3-oxo-5a-steroid 4- dehydrogenase [Piccolia ochrophora]|nr:MAG: 3-oxo-5a-steroid 4- dehydrogenase [Piccolia ochrophora]
MSSKSLTLSLRPRGNAIPHLPSEYTSSSSSSTHDVYEGLSRTAKVSVHRLRLTKGSDGSFLPNSTDLTVNATGLREQSVIYVKDLGPQIAWRTVFVLEYLGPLIIHPILYYFLTSSSPSTLQTLTLTLITLHFAKRELETLFIHRFSAATMPLVNLPKNCAHYWLLSGLNLAYWTYVSSSPTARESNPWITYPALVAWAVGEVGNLGTHVVLRNLRSHGGKERGVPTGWGFGTVTCPNYGFEVLVWVAVWALTWSLSAGIFVAVAGVQMALWARKKEGKYRREFGDKYKRKRSVMVPGLI